MNGMIKFSICALLAFALQSNVALAAGAIAVDDDVKTGAGEAGYGVGSGDSRAEAAEAALRSCKKAGNDSCEVVVRYDNCGAYASSKKHSGIGWGRSEEEAKSKALDDCGTDNCKIVVSDCS